MKKFLLILLIIPFISNTSPWVTADEASIRLKLEFLPLCGINLPNLNKFPYNLSNAYNEINDVDVSGKSQECRDLISNLEEHIRESVSKTSIKIGFQSKGMKEKLLDFGTRQLQYSHSYFSLENTSSNWSVKIRAAKINQVESNEYRFDESYLAYTFNNKIVTFGRVSKWWSPSWDTSLIFSNNIRPIPSLSFSNNLATAINIPVLRLLGPMNYEFYLGQLEDNRHIPDAKLLGTRISFSPKPKFNISLFRTGQFGGEGRPEDLKTLSKFILGKDNVGYSGVTSENQPGNQLAGIDFKLKILKNNNLELFSQIVGEDKGEQFLVPTKTFYNIGMGYSFFQKGGLQKIILEFTDTKSYIKKKKSQFTNITYNHSVYQDGYRYYKKPIGSAIDADSSKIALSYFYQLLDNKFLKIKYFDADINQNMSQKNFWGENPRILKGLELSYNTQVNKKINLFIEYIAFEDEYQSKKNKDQNLLFRIEYLVF